MGNTIEHLIEHPVTDLIIITFILLDIVVNICAMIRTNDSKVRMADILMSLAFLSIIALVFFTVYQKPEGGSFDLTILTVSFALAAIIPYIVGNSVAKNEVNNIVEEKFKSVERKYATSLFSLRKQNAHSKRMSANLLNSVNGITNKKWALGWASEALISYIQISSIYDSTKYVDECINIIKNINDASLEKNEGEVQGINKRTLKSLLTMHAYLDLNHKPTLDKINNNSISICNMEAKLLILMMHEDNQTNIQEYIKSKDYRSFCKSCKISDLNDVKENIQITTKVESIITDDVIHLIKKPNNYTTTATLS